MIESEHYALLCYRYIELNPVRAKMVDHPSEYSWSSYRQNAVGKDDKLISHHVVYTSLAGNDEGSREAYRALFDGFIDQATLLQIREMTNKSWVVR